MSTQQKITVKKRGEVWDVDCPHCFKPHGALYIFSSFTSAIAWARTHLRGRHAAPKHMWTTPKHTWTLEERE